MADGGRVPIKDTFWGEPTNPELLNDQQRTIKRLKQLGYSDDAIRRLVAQGSKVTGFESVPSGLGGLIPVDPGIPTGKIGGIATRAGTPLKSGSTAGNILGSIFGNSPIASVLGMVKDRITDPRSNASKIGRTVTNVAQGITGQRSPNSQGGAVGKQGPALMGGEFPDWGQFAPGAYTPPELALHDFSGQANDSVTSAFAPYFAALAQQKTDTQTRGDRDRQIVGGLYEKYVSDIASQAAQTQQRYDQQEATRAQQGQDLNASIGQNYAGANADTAQLLQSIGAQQAAPQLLQQGANDQGWQQGQADQNTQAHQDYYNTNETAQADQSRVYGQAAQNEGIRGQANVMADTASLLQQLGLTESKQRSDNALTALDLAQKMQQQDFSAQQANAQLGQGAYSAQSQAAQNAYDAAVGLYGAKRQNIQDQQQQTNWERTFNRDTQQAGLDNQLNWLKLQGSSAQKPIDPTGLNSVTQQISQGAGSQIAADISRAAYDSTAGSNTPVNDQNAYFSFMQKVQQIAEANNTTAAAVIPFMQQFWVEYSKGNQPNQG